MSYRPLLIGMAALGAAFPVLAPPVSAGDQADVTFAWEAPPAEAPRKRTPRLVNYCHISSELAGYRTPELEKMLAQWDVLVLFPYEQVNEPSPVFPDRIRAWNPKVRILAWMPLQGPSGVLWRRCIPESSLELWSGHDTSGKIVMAPWGEVVMNPVADGRGWPRHVISFLEGKCLSRPSTHYDGAMLDCLSSAPMFGIDANRDGRQDQRDTDQWREAYLWMLQELRRRHPRILLLGNAGQPLSARDPYLQWLNGSLHENALGNQGGPGEWRQVWDGYRAAVSVSAKQGRETMHFIVADVRMDRSLEEARQLGHLTATDLRRMRLGLCTSLLLDGGYFGFDRGDCLHGQLWWFDEYDANIGAPVEKYRNGALGVGLYSRRYDLGLVVVNTRDQPVTINLGVAHFDYTTKKIAPNHVIPPWDGRILRAGAREP